MIKAMIGKIIGTRNQREIKRYQKRVGLINALEKEYEGLDDSQLQARFEELRTQVQGGEKSLDEVLISSFAITREASKRILGMRHFDVQLIGGMVLHEGKIAEMKTGGGQNFGGDFGGSLKCVGGAECACGYGQ
ncbi:protein export cytoplasm protein SecA ATPase RNA helicase (TC 3.A.5.1.1) [Helicobacter bizzozeronii CIII-1]|uniref:Protein export cytoplasm protein SecA ATPase RNA helicase (TC 3.A.5.1.1) n=1 Tax=Helicobacter bizzozeronii (strain CIII-1) TaxID=1002804 RepID=F8KQE7_HELBC|nr:protein export cytoplasm protein SecA ATPase RNA helicase (TC 3.A.5.1.1) [Helicobacter bizzozeronii CIII-1]